MYIFWIILINPDSWGILPTCLWSLVAADKKFIEFGEKIKVLTQVTDTSNQKK